MHPSNEHLSGATWLTLEVPTSGNHRPNSVPEHQHVIAVLVDNSVHVNSRVYLI